MVDPARVYRWLIRLYPARFREEYQSPMERQFLDDYRDAEGPAARTVLWLHAVLDLAASVPAESFRELAQDLRYALRVYRSRSFSASLAVLALGLAIGASTAVFSILNALLLRSLPFSDPASLVEIWRSPVGAGAGRAAFADWRQRSPYLGDAAAFSASEMNLTRERAALRVKVAETSANFFQVLGTSTVTGRTFAQGEDAPGHTAVAIISHSLWQQTFGGDPTVPGAHLNLNGTPLTIIGVAPARFDYPGNTSVWIPTVFDFEKVPKRGAFLFQTLGRLRPMTTLPQAQKLLQAEAQRLKPQSLTGDIENRPRLIPLRDQLAGSVRQAAWVLCGIVLFVLLAACANVAQLLLSRTTERHQELALRSALGASRARLLQQLITEATALTVSGAILGLLVAQWGAAAASSIAPPQLAAQQYTVVDWRVLGFAAVLTLLIGVFFGVAPAWLVGRLLPSAHHVRIQSGAPGVSTRRIRASLLAFQAALTLTLVAGSFTMGRTFLHLLDADLGFKPKRVVTLTVSLQGTRYRTASSQWQYYSDALDRLRAVPGVETAGAVSYLPLAANVFMAGSLKLDSGQQVQGIILNGSMPRYFDAIGTRVLAGRDFAAGEGRNTEPAVIVNETFARQTGAGTSIVGRRLIAPWSKRPYMIVGVVDTARLAGPDFPGGPQAYWPVEEEPPGALTFVARVHGDSESALAPCRDAIRMGDPEVAIYDVKTLEQRLAEALARPRFYTSATLFFAALAVLLAMIGIYGAASYSVAQRTREMGVRMALGASRHRVRSMIIGESMLPISVGMAAGIAAAIVSGKYLESLIANTEPMQLPSCAAAAVFLLLIALLAAWSATGRVLRIDPAEALRAE